MKILAIETSCDETAISILQFQKDRGKILADFVYSQVAIHQPFGGIVPNLAKREHQKNLAPFLKLALKKAGLLTIKRASKKQRNEEKIKIIGKILEKEEILKENFIDFVQKYEKAKIDLIAVTHGPGLAPALWPGVNFAKALSFYWQIPVIGINHLEGHLFANWLPKKENQWAKIELPSKKFFPAIGLIISGGHTQLVLIKKLGDYKIIGETRDDAAGECFDKTARLLNLGYPGGPAIAAEADKFKILNLKSKIVLPRPMIHSKDYDFSFAGLKTAVLYLVEDLKKKGVNLKNLTPALAFEIQNSINEVLVSKTLKAAKNFRAKSIILGGGVTANSALIELLKKEAAKKIPDTRLFIPLKKYTGDNATMIALTAWFYIKEKKFRFASYEKLEADANLRF